MLPWVRDDPQVFNPPFAKHFLFPELILNPGPLFGPPARPQLEAGGLGGAAVAAVPLLSAGGGVGAVGGALHVHRPAAQPQPGPLDGLRGRGGRPERQGSLHLRDQQLKPTSTYYFI